MTRVSHFSEHQSQLQSERVQAAGKYTFHKFLYAADAAILGLNTEWQLQQAVELRKVVENGRVKAVLLTVLSDRFRGTMSCLECEGRRAQ